MSGLLKVVQSDDAVTIQLDDGKANVMSLAMLDAINGALDQAEAMGGVLIIQGRPGMFCAGFDLNVFKSGTRDDKLAMLKAGAELTERLLSFPFPTLAACTGHAVAMGTFLLLSCDYRIGIEGNSKFAANEVSIGLIVPRFATLVSRQRLTPAALNRGLTLAHFFDTGTALQAGFLDEVATAEAFAGRVADMANLFTKLDMEAHVATKLRLRAELLPALRKAIDEDMVDWQNRYR